MNLDAVAKTVQVLSVVAGVVISVLSFNATREKELQTQRTEMEARRLEAAKPFLELRQKLYMEALKAAAVLSTPEDRTKDELRAAKRRFRELYVAELSMVEEAAVEGGMMQLAAAIDPALTHLDPAQKAAYDLAHALRDSFVASWDLRKRDVR